VLFGHAPAARSFLGEIRPLFGRILRNVETCLACDLIHGGATVLGGRIANEDCQSQLLIEQGGATMKLVTDRLIMREFQERDWQAVHEWDSDPEVVRYLTFDCERTEEAARAKVSEGMATACQEPRGRYAWVIATKEHDQAIGELDLHVSTHRVSAWVAYRIHPDCRGRGYVTEALRQVLEFGFEELRLHRIKLTPDPRNPAGGREARHALRRRVPRRSLDRR
jgi:[ribosomal protein S5]-alanine N-acetyltransferase